MYLNKSTYLSCILTEVETLDRERTWLGTEVLMRHLLHSGSSSRHTQATSERAADAVCTCVKVKNDDRWQDCSVSWKAVTRAFDVKHKLFFICPFSVCDSQLCAARYLNLDKAMPVFACPCWWCECTQPPLCLPFTLKNDVTFSKQKLPVPVPSQPEQQAQRVGTHTNKVEGHFSNYWASQPPSQAA